MSRPEDEDEDYTVVVLDEACDLFADDRETALHWLLAGCQEIIAKGRYQP